MTFLLLLQTPARPDRDAAKQTAPFRLVVILYIQEMPVGLALVGENEERVRMLAQQLRNHRTLGAARASIGHEAAIDDVESIILTATREQHGVFRQSFTRRFRPAAPGKRLVHALVIELDRKSKRLNS